MSRVDVESMLRQHANVYGTRTRFLYPINGTGCEFNDFESDEFRMYKFKILMCPLNRTHDWTNCPYAHVGERARRRDPCQVPYMPVSCQEYRATGGFCPRGETCQFAHGVFEYWLHPAKYRTRLCNGGTKCTRAVCFFAHNLDELRVEPTNLVPERTHLSFEEELEAQVRMLSMNHVASNNSHIGRRQITSLSQTSMLSPTNVASTSSGIVSTQGLGVIGHHNTPNPLLIPPSYSGITSTTISERPQELRLEFLESLRPPRINEPCNNIRANRDFDEPNVDWVTDLLAG